MELTLLVVWCIAMLIGLGSLAVWIWALVDCVRRTFAGDNEKLIWVVVIVLANTIGAIIYLIVGRPKGWLPGETSATDN